MQVMEVMVHFKCHTAAHACGYMYPLLSLALPPSPWCTRNYHLFRGDERACLLVTGYTAPFMKTGVFQVRQQGQSWGQTS